jgi:hypothetical protein
MTLEQHIYFGSQPVPVDPRLKKWGERAQEICKSIRLGKAASRHVATSVRAKKVI